MAHLSSTSPFWFIYSFIENFYTHFYISHSRTVCEFATMLIILLGFATKYLTEKACGRKSLFGLYFEEEQSVCEEGMMADVWSGWSYHSLSPEADDRQDMKQ